MYQTVKSIALRIFGRKLRGKADLFAQDIVAVATGLKRSFLVDYFLADQDDVWVAFLGELDKTGQPALQALCVVVTSETLVFLLHRTDLFIEEPLKRIFIDICPRLRLPKIHDGAVPAMLENARESLCDTLTSTQRMTVCRLQVKGLCQVALSGWLLGYPVVYVLGGDEEAAAGGNCLGGIPLVRHHFTARLKTTGSESLVTLASFTIPQQLLRTDAICAAVKGYSALMAKRLEHQDQFSSLDITTELVSLEKVIV